MTALATASATPRRLSRAVGADADRRRLAGAAACRSAPFRSPHSPRCARPRGSTATASSKSPRAAAFRCAGLSAASAPRFAADIAALGIAAADGVPVLTNPLAGIRCRRNSRCRRARRRVARARWRSDRCAAKLGAKVSVAIDGGGALDLDALAADVRLRASGRRRRGASRRRRRRWRERRSTRPRRARSWRRGGHRLARSHRHSAAAMRVRATFSRRKALRRISRRLSRDLAHRRSRPPRHRAPSLSDAIGIHRAARWLVRLRHRPCLRPCRCDDRSNDWLMPANAAGASGVRAAPGRALMAIGLDARHRAGFCRCRRTARLHRSRRRSAPARRRLRRRADLRLGAHRRARNRAAHRRIRCAVPQWHVHDPHFRLRQGLRACRARRADRRRHRRRLRAGRQRFRARRCRSPSFRPHELPAADRAVYARAKARGRPCLSAPPICATARRSMQRSFAIIRAEADLSRFSADEADVAVRMIHACGLVEVAQHIVFGGDLVAAARGALAAGAPILCDAEMVAHGITRARLPAKQRSDLHAQRSAHRGARRKNAARRARRRRSICGATASAARSSPSAMRRPPCSGCSI